MTRVSNLDHIAMLASITINYDITRYLTKRLSTDIPNEFTVQEIFAFDVISQLDTHERFLVSYNLTSLFTNIQLK